jgi:hypothetical protein
VADHAIDRLVSARQLEERAAGTDEVVGFWLKAIRAYNDARNASTSLDNRYERAYTAARLAATTVVRASGYRPRGGEGHHHTVFYAAQHLVGGEVALADAFVQANAMRQVRHAIEYDFEDELETEDVEKALDLVERVLLSGADYLRSNRPDAKPRIRKIRPRAE